MGTSGHLSIIHIQKRISTSFDQLKYTKRQLKKQFNMERDKLSSLKLKLYLFSSVNAEQRQDQRKMLVKDNKDISLTGPTTYTFDPTIKINT